MAIAKITQALKPSQLIAKVNEIIDGFNNKVVNKTNLTIATTAWAASSEKSGYSYKANLAVSGITTADQAYLKFSDADVTSMNFCVGAISANAIAIYAKTKPTATITIPFIRIMKGG
ncbi:hypothetical protein [Holdemania massiliensis]|uniref:hypothetical protein n=1 Tax=Holdemania massiliensis TaxID=1468449 RepID=UPI00242E7856|nr:hypothetical protein [Holdemania massiliensis]